MRLLTNFVELESELNHCYCKLPYALKRISDAPPFLVYCTPTFSSGNGLQFWHSVNTTSQVQFLTVSWISTIYVTRNYIFELRFQKCCKEYTRIIFSCVTCVWSHCRPPCLALWMYLFLVWSQECQTRPHSQAHLLLEVIWNVVNSEAFFCEQALSVFQSTLLKQISTLHWYTNLQVIHHIHMIFQLKFTKQIFSWLSGASRGWWLEYPRYQQEGSVI